MTVREALRGLLAVPYWVITALFDGAVAPAFPGWWCYVACVVIGLASAAVQPPLLGWCASWAWARVEILASAWKELQR